MNVYKTLQIGEFHTLYCEDFLLSENISNKRKLIAVLDGCTMGKESVFASILYGKILRTIANKEYYKEFVSKETAEASLNDTLKNVLNELFLEVKKVQQQLDLSKHELLSTLILGIVDTDTKNAEFIVIGDGLVVCNGQTYDFEQEDKPDYLGYHLQEDFEKWYHNQDQKLSFTECYDISIATDGIFTFKNLKNAAKQRSEEELIQYLLVSTDGNQFENMLDRKIKKLREDENIVVTDDLAIVRVVL